MAKEGINLATMWLPLAPSIEGDEFKNAGKRAFQQFSGGFDAENAGSAEGKRFADKWVGGFKSSFTNADFGGFTKAFEKINQQVDAVASKKLGAHLPALRQEYEKTTAEMYKLREALHQIQVADDQATATGRGTIQMLVQRRKLESEYAESGKKAVAAQKEYNSTLSEYEAVSAKAATASSLLGGVMGGAVVLGAQAVIGAFDDVIEMGEHLFEGAVEATRRAGEALLDLGEKYEGLNHQILEFSGASGEALTALQEHAAKVLGGLDVAGDDVGKTMATLASRMHAEAGPALDQLTGTLTELQGRFGDLRTMDIATIFTDWGMGVDQASAALDTLVANSTAAGVSVGAVTAEMKGPLSETLQAVGLSFGQATHVAALLAAQGIPTNDAVRGVGTAMKVAKAHGMSLAQTLTEAAKEFANITDPAERDAFMLDLFGTKAVDGARFLGDLNDTLGESSNAFDGAAGSAQALNDKTETLENKVESLKNHMAGMFKPFAEGAVAAVDGGLSKISGWFMEHEGEIARKIQAFGDGFIDQLPTIKNFVITAIDFFKPIAMFFEGLASMALLAGAGIEAVFGHFDRAEDLKNLAVSVGMTPGGSAFDHALDNAKDYLRDMDTHSESLHRHLADAADAAQGIKVGPDGSRSWWGTDLPSSGGTNSSGAAPGGGPTQPSSQPPPPGYVGGGGSFDASGNASFDWNLVAQAESTGNWQNADTGHNGHFGGLQFSTSTWAEYGGLEFADRPDKATKEQQITVANRTAFTGWGGNQPQGLKAWQTITEGKVPGVHASKGMHVQGDPTIHEDHVPILAKHGEYVWSTEAVDRYGPLIDMFNQKAVKGFKGGGLVGPAFSQVIWTNTETGQNVGENDGQWVGPGTSQPGFYRDDWGGHTGHVHTTVEHDPFTGQLYDQVPAGSNIRQGGSGFPDWVYRLGDQYGVVPSTYPGHQEWGGINHGIDWWPKDAAPNMAGAGYTHEDHETLTGFAQAVGQSATGTASPAGSAGSGVQLTGFTTTDGSGGSFPFGSGGSAGGAAGGGGGMYGGYTPGTPQADEAYSRNKAVRDSGNRITGLQAELADTQDKLNKANDALTAEQKQPLGGDPTKLADIHKQIAELQKRIDKITNEELPDANQDYSQAQERAGEPIKGKSKSSSMDSEAKKLGSSFLSGLAQEFGLDGLIGKSPAEFGITKLFGGIMKYIVSGLGGGADGGRAQGVGPNIVAGMFPGAPNLAATPAVTPGTLPATPGLPYAAPVIGTTPPLRPGPAPGPATAPAQAPAAATAPAPAAPAQAPVAPLQPPVPPSWAHPADVKPSGFAKQTPAGAPGSIVPKPPGQQPISFSKGLPKADTEGPNLFGNRYAAGFDDGHGGRQAAPEGSPWASAVDSLTTMALSYAAKAVPGVGGKGAGFQMSGTGGGAGGDGGQGQPLGATGIMETTGSVPTFYGGGGGDTHNHNYGDNIQHIDNSKTWNIKPESDPKMVSAMQSHANSMRSNAALASAPGSLQSYP
jgi:Transglycosylase-like domain